MIQMVVVITAADERDTVGGSIRRASLQRSSHTRAEHGITRMRGDLIG